MLQSDLRRRARLAGHIPPYGEEYNPQFTANHYKFTGKERDTESNLDYFGARHYSSTLGRWVSADWSAVPVPVPYADFGDPQSLNLYSYVRNLPTTRVDGNGHCDDCSKVNVSVKEDGPAHVLTASIDGKTITGVGTMTTITFTDSNGPIAGLEVKESPVVTNNRTGAVSAGLARQETIKTDDAGTIRDVVMQPVIPKALPSNIPKEDAERTVAEVAGSKKVDKTYQQNLTFTIKDTNGRDCTCTATYSQSLSNVGPNGKLNKPDGSGVNFKYRVTSPVSVKRADSQED